MPHRSLWAIKVTRPSDINASSFRPQMYFPPAVSRVAKVRALRPNQGPRPQAAPATGHRRHRVGVRDSLVNQLLDLTMCLRRRGRVGKHHCASHLTATRHEVGTPPRNAQVRVPAPAIRNHSSQGRSLTRGLDKRRPPSGLNTRVAPNRGAGHASAEGGGRHRQRTLEGSGARPVHDHGRGNLQPKWRECALELSTRVCIFLHLPTCSSRATLPSKQRCTRRVGCGRMARQPDPDATPAKQLADTRRCWRRGKRADQCQSPSPGQKANRQSGCTCRDWRTLGTQRSRPISLGDGSLSPAGPKNPMAALVPAEAAAAGSVWVMA